MIKVSVYYPRTPEGRFDGEYYAGPHTELVRKLMGETLRDIEADIGLSGPAPDSDPHFAGALHMYFDTVGGFRTAFDANAAQFRADMPNYTDIKPIMQISEVRRPSR